MQTTTNTVPSAGPSTPAFKSFGSRLSAAWRRLIADTFSRQALNRRVLHRLSVLSDRELSDIGLSRYDVASAALPGNGDATLYLVARQNERRNAQRGSAPF